MKVSWEIRTRELALPPTSIVDGSPHAAPVALNVLAYSGLWVRRVTVPLTGDQARRMRPSHVLAAVSAGLGLLALPFVMAAVLVMILGPTRLLGATFGTAMGISLTNGALQLIAAAVRPRQYPRVPFDVFRRGGRSDRIELRDVDPGTARAWQGLTAGAVTAQH